MSWLVLAVNQDSRHLLGARSLDLPKPMDRRDAIGSTSRLPYLARLRTGGEVVLRAAVSRCDDEIIVDLAPSIELDSVEHFIGSRWEPYQRPKSMITESEIDDFERQRTMARRYPEVFRGTTVKAPSTATSDRDTDSRRYFESVCEH